MIPKPLVSRKPKSILRKRVVRRHTSSVNKASKPTSDARGTEGGSSKQRANLRFAAPVKIIIIDPKAEYCKTVWCAIGIALINIAIGAVLVAVLLYSMRKNDAHAAVCTLAFHFFAAEAILAFHYVNGWSSPMRKRHKQFAHIFLQLCGVLSVIIGTILVFTKFGLNWNVFKSVHSCTGMLAVIIIIINTVFGGMTYSRRWECVVTCHFAIGIIVFLLASICVCVGTTLKAFRTWSGEPAVYILIGLIIYYTVFILVGSFLRCMSRFSNGT